VPQTFLPEYRGRALGRWTPFARGWRCLVVSLLDSLGKSCDLPILRSALEKRWTRMQYYTKILAKWTGPLVPLCDVWILGSPKVWVGHLRSLIRNRPDSGTGPPGQYFLCFVGSGGPTALYRIQNQYCSRFWTLAHQASRAGSKIRLCSNQ